MVALNCIYLLKNHEGRISVILQASYGGAPLAWSYYRGLNNYQYHFEVHLRYPIQDLYEEYGTLILAIIPKP